MNLLTDKILEVCARNELCMAHKLAGYHEVNAWSWHNNCCSRKLYKAQWDHLLL